MLIADLEGRFLEANLALCSMLGRSQSELIRCSIVDVTHPDDMARAREAIEAAATGEALNFDIELKLIDRHGAALWTRFLGSPARDAHGRPMYMVGQIQNVTDHKHAEDDLHHTLATYRTLVEQIPASIYVTAADDVGHLLFQSPQIAWLLGYSSEEWLAEPDAWRNHVHPDDLKRVTSSDGEASASGDAFCLEYRFIARDGRVVWVRDEAQLVRDNLGQPIRWHGITIDITGQKEAEAQLRLQQALLTAITESTLDGIAVLSDSGTVLAVNQQFLKLWNIPDASAFSGSSAVLHAYCIAQVADQVSAQAEVDNLNQHPEIADRKELLLKDGRVFDRFTRAVVGPDGAHYGRVWYYRDNTERSQMEHSLRVRERQLAEAQRLAGLGSWAWNIESNMAYWSDESYRILGFVPGDVQPSLEAFLNVVHPDDIPGVRKAIRAAVEEGTPYQLDITICRHDGMQRIVQARCEVVKEASGQVTSLRGTMLDITERKALETRLALQALQDPLTSLPNRRSLAEQLDLVLAGSRDGSSRVALLFLDLDDFKAVNDRFGHDAGDDVLIEVANRLRRVLRDGDMVARLGGDEFVVLLEHIEDAGAAIRLAERLLRAVSAPIPLGSEAWRLTASIGIVLSDETTADAEVLLQGSDAAMYSAKSRGKACWVAAEPLSGSNQTDHSSS
jgi:diguanylate cyclase (GGDEF)-like protein/PAS domain S-box-containing protein